MAQPSGLASALPALCQSWADIGHSCSLLISQKLRPAPHLLEQDIHLDASLADSHALRHPRSHSGFSGWPLRTAGGVASRDWMMGGCGAHGLSLGDREAGTSGQPGSSPLGLGRPWLHQVNKGSTKDPSLLTLTCRVGVGDCRLSTHCRRWYLISGGDMVGSQDWGPPAPSRHAGPRVRLVRPGETSCVCFCTSVGLWLQIVNRTHVPPLAGTRPRPSPYRPRQPLITTSTNVAKGPLPLLPSMTPRNQVRGPCTAVPCGCCHPRGGPWTLRKHENMLSHLSCYSQSHREQADPIKMFINPSRHRLEPAP